MYPQSCWAASAPLIHTVVLRNEPSKSSHTAEPFHDDGSVNSLRYHSTRRGMNE